MSGMKELYHEEQKVLSDYLEKVKKEDIFLEDAFTFALYYKELLDQSKVITKVSDRLQKKLDQASQKIKSQNEEIKFKNIKLEDTIGQLVSARVGKKASRILLTLALVLFVCEEIFLSDIIEEYISIPFLSMGLKGGLAFSLKFFEGNLETYFMKVEQKKILKEKEALSKKNKPMSFSKGNKVAMA